MNIPHHRRQEATIWVCAILIPVLVVLASESDYSCLSPDAICDAYSSPSHTPWRPAEGWGDCLQGCLDEFWNCPEWDDEDVASCIECCYDFYFPRFPI